jgi:hypothetical protein
MESNSSMTHGHEAKGYKALLDGLITLSGAEGEEGDMRAELQYCTKRAIFYNKLQSHETEIRSLVASHCGLASSNLVQVPEMVEPVNGKLVWLHGSFNVCIPVHVKNLEHSIPSKMCFRVPLPYKIGEETFPGNADEKLRTEAATYIWIDENCPNIPIPKLRGFGVAGGLSVGTYFPTMYLLVVNSRVKAVFSPSIASNMAKNKVLFLAFILSSQREIEILQLYSTKKSDILG